MKGVGGCVAGLERAGGAGRVKEPQAGLLGFCLIGERMDEVESVGGE